MTYPTTAPSAGTFAGGIVSQRNSVAQPTMIDAVIDENHRGSKRQLDEYVNRNRGLIARYFPSESDKILAAALRDRTTTELEYRQKLLTLATEAKLESCREHMDTWQRSMKVELHAQFAGFISEKYTKLATEIEIHRDDTIRRLEHRYQRLLQLAPMPGPQAAYQRDTDEEFSKALAWYSGLLDRFQAIVNERLQQFGARA